MRRTTAALMTVLVAALGAGPLPPDRAWADAGVVDARLDHPGRVEVVMEIPPVLEELAARAGERSGRRWVPVPVVGFVDDDLRAGVVTVCRATRWVEVRPGEDRDVVLATAQAAYLVAINAAFHEWRVPGGVDAPCPFDPAEDLPAAVVEEAVRRTAVAQLPRPRPTIPPGLALTGLPAYLVTGHLLGFGPVTRRLDLGTVSPAVTFSGTGTTTVVWGDGATSSHDVPGRPYPDGEVVHTYRDRGTYTVQVIDTWRVTYDVDGILGGVLEATLDPVTIEAFPVQEYRAVRTLVRR
jgi:hypothetical protein